MATAYCVKCRDKKRN